MFRLLSLPDLSAQDPPEILRHQSFDKHTKHLLIGSEVGGLAISPSTVSAALILPIFFHTAKVIDLACMTPILSKLQHIILG